MMMTTMRTKTSYNTDMTCGFVWRCDIWKIIIICDGYSSLLRPTLYDKRNPLMYGITLLDTSRWKWHIYMNEFVIQMRWFLKFTKRSKFKTIKHHFNKRVGFTHNIKGIRSCVMRNNEILNFLQNAFVFLFH